MKKIVTTVVILFVIVSFNSLFAAADIPVTLMDALLVPMGLAITFWVFTPKFLSGDYLSPSLLTTHQLLPRLTFAAVLLLFFIFSAVMIYVGASEPLVLFLGVRGSGHGYSLLAVGVAIFSFAISCSYSFVVKRYKK